MSLVRLLIVAGILLGVLCVEEQAATPASGGNYEGTQIPRKNKPRPSAAARPVKKRKAPAKPRAPMAPRKPASSLKPIPKR
jgi:hypothetical protein